MIVYVGLILLLALYGAKFRANGIFTGYLSPKSSSAIKGIFILLIFVSHFSYYVGTFTAPLDLAFIQLRTMLGQTVVVYFLFCSGYGVMLSAATRGEEYMRSFPVKRILPTLLAYDLAQVLFLLVELGRGQSYSLSRILLTFLSWETFGNGIDNWYIFIILSLYVISWLALRGRKADKPAVMVITAASFALIAVLACVKPRHWFNTLLCYPLGMWYYLYKEKIEGYLNSNAAYWKTAGAVGLLFVFFHKFWYLRPAYLTTMLLFALMVVVVTMKVQVNNRFLTYCGRHVQGLFLLHRIPMTILGGVSFMREQMHLWFISSVVFTFALEYLFSGLLTYMRKAPASIKNIEGKNERWDGKWSYTLLSRHRGELMGLALLVILIFHAFKLSLPVAAVKAIKTYGYLGVDVFIFLSAMGLSMSLSRKKQSLKEFYCRRFVRILPAYWLVTGGFGLALLAAGRTDFKEIFWTMSTLFYWLDKPNYFNWYIPELIAFYLLAPLCHMLLRRSKYRMFKVAVIFGVAFALSKTVGPLVTDLNSFIFRIPVFFIGIVAGLYISEGRVLTATELSLWGVVALLPPVIGEILSKADIYFHPCNTFAFICMFICLLAARLLAFLPERGVRGFLRLLGSCSLEIYLLNVVFVLSYDFLAPALNGDPQHISYYAITISLNILLGIGFHQLLKAPQNWLLRLLCSESGDTERSEEKQPEESAAPQQESGAEVPCQLKAEEPVSIRAKAPDTKAVEKFRAEPGENTVLTVRDVSIRYLLGDFKDIGLKEYVMRQLKGDYHITEFWADHHISFSLERGDMLGIIGTNGAGKSTLLKAIAGIMEPTGGYVKREGNISALLELASGFDGNLTVRENAYLRGAMLGYTRKFMDEKYPEIIEFAELQDFQDRPFKQLSSGMMSRLAFAVASLVHPDILILDEVLSVGDGAFRKKSEDKMREIMGGGTTTILVSHSVEQVREMCNKVLWIEKGNQIGFGSAETLCGLYQQYLNGELSLEEARRILGAEGEMDRPEDRFVTRTVDERAVWVARLKRYAYLPLCFLALLGAAGAFHQMYGLTFYPSITVPLMVGWSLLFTSIAAILPGIAKKVYFGFLGIVFAVLPIVHEVYSNMFRKFFSFADMAFAGDGFAFLDSSYLVFNRPILLLSLLFLAAMVCCILLTRKLKLSKTILWGGGIGILAGAVLIAGVCLKSFRGDGKVVWDMNEDPTTIYKSFTDRRASLSLLGLYHYTFRDIELALFPSGEHLSADELAEIDAYASSHVHEDNELTGALSGKNLILVQLEAIDTWMLEDYMPALKAVKEQSVVFANHYTPAYITAGTFNTEFMVNTGLMPAATGTSTGVYVQNEYPSSLAHLFAERGYTANSFHGSEANVYNRGAIHEVWGYDYHSGNDMGLENFTMDSQLTTAYEDMTPGSPFLTFIITYSGHGPYGDTNPTYLAHADAAWAQAKRTDGNYVYAVAHAMETDQFVADLMERLEADGLLENTAVVFYADHYNYYMLNDALQMDIKGVDSMNLLQHTDFFVYSKDLAPRTVEKYTSSLDVLPTLANLFDLDADYAHLAGDDAFSASGGYVIFNDNTWLGTDRDVSAEIMRRRRINTLLLKGNYWREGVQ